jgi:tRNA1Val (adenine37-N6)-methyltransferase
MANPYFSFKQFTVWQDQAAMKVTTDACLLGAWASDHLQQHFTVNPVEPARAPRLADVGTGTGLLAMMIHQKNPSFYIDGLEIDPQAAQQALHNVEQAGFQQQIQIHTVDVTSFDPAEPYDIIISNPPFYQDDLKAMEQKRNWAFHDDTLTLAALFRFISAHLSATGKFFLLLPCRREQEVQALLHSHDLCLVEKTAVKTAPHSLAHRLLLAGKRGKASTYPLEKEICIGGETGSYSNRFRELLTDYYLTL